MKKWLAAGLVVVVALVSQGVVDGVCGRELCAETGPPVVQDPANLTLINARHSYTYIKDSLKDRGILGRIRYEALKAKIKHMGFPDMSKEDLYVGYVTNSGANGSSLIAVLKGDLNESKVNKFIAREHRRYVRRVNRIAKKNGERELKSDDLKSGLQIEGCDVASFSYLERPYEMVVTSCNGYLVMGAVPKSDHSLLEKTVMVLKGELPLNETVPASLQATTRFSFSGRELRDILYYNADVESIQSQVTDQAKKVFDRLGIEVSEEKLVPLKDRIRNQLVESKSVGALYEYTRDDYGTSTYVFEYGVEFENSREAEAFRSLVAEKIGYVAGYGEEGFQDWSFNDISAFTHEDSFYMSIKATSEAVQFQLLASLVEKLYEYNSVDNWFVVLK